MKFIENFPINKIIPAKYNPRIINKTQFEKLKESLKILGMIKPVIINGKNNILIAGHQRLKAVKELNLNTIPAIIVDKISASDEIMFNLFHNSIETSNSEVLLDDFNDIHEGYSSIDYKKIKFSKNKSPLIVKEISKLIIKYGNWGSVICDTKGRIIYNSEYAIACKLLEEPLLIYKITDDKLLNKYLKLNYGEYNYEKLSIKDYNQTYCQMNRLVNGEIQKSTTYEQFVLPNINKNERILDFGAGKCKYPLKYNELGYSFFMYEPYFRTGNLPEFNIEKTVEFINKIDEDISENGLYDVVVLDSVLNSITSDKMQHNLLLSCNGLTKNSGKLILGTRNLLSVNHFHTAKTSINGKREIEFLDKNNFSVTFRNGVWTKQKFHTKESLSDLLKKYFNKIEIFGREKGNCIYAICENPIKFLLKDYKIALNIEFNMPYPNNIKHNQHKNLVKTILNFKSAS